MRLIRSILAVLFAAIALAGAAKAQGIDLGGHDSNEPIAVAADDFTGDLNTKEGTYRGNVIVTQGDFKLHADNVQVLTNNGAIDNIVATGHVLFDAPKGQAQGEKGVYKVVPRTVTLTGQVVLTRNKNVMRGTQLVVNLETGKAQLTAHGAPGGRVQGLFVPPPKEKKPAAKPAKPDSDSGTPQ